MSGTVRLLFLYVFMAWTGTALPLIIIIIITPAIIGATRIVTKGLKKKFGSHIRKIFNRLTTKCSKAWNITRTKECAAVCSWKPEGWGSPLVQEKYQGEKACDRRQHNNNTCNFVWA
jgi:hypothetical protein